MLIPDTRQEVHGGGGSHGRGLTLAGPYTALQELALLGFHKLVEPRVWWSEACCVKRGVSNPK